MSPPVLPTVDPAEAYLRQVVPAALSGRRVEGAPLRADCPRERPERLAWFRCADGWAFAAERLQGQAIALSPDDGPGAAALLEQVESLLRQVELGLGIALEPDQVVATAPAGALLFRLTIDAGDRLWLAVPPDATLLPTVADFAPELLPQVAVPVTLTIEGPRVPPHDAAGLAPGDLLLLGTGPLAAALAAAGAPNRLGRFDPATGGFHPS